MSRRSRFIVSLILGLVMGLIFGWVLKPVEIVDIAPSMLNPGYRSDIVLMVAEVYSSSQDLDAAVLTLDTLFSQSPSISIASSIAFYSDNGYTLIERAYLQALAEAVNSRLPGISP